MQLLNMLLLFLTLQFVRSVDNAIYCSFFLGVGNDPREDRYFSIPKQVSAFIQILFFSFLGGG